MPDKPFVVENGRLRLTRQPELTELEPVRSALFGLLEGDAAAAELDMTGMEKIGSATVGMAVAVHLRAAEAGKRLVVRIRKDQKRLFDLTMLTDTLNLDVVAGGGPSR